MFSMRSIALTVVAVLAFAADGNDVGGIPRSMELALVTAGCKPAVYSHADAATPNDLGSAVQPKRSARAVNGGHRLAFVPVGSYIVVFTCRALAGTTLLPGATTTLSIS